MKIEYPKRLSLAQLPTPIHCLQRYSDNLGTGHRIWVKRDDLTGASASGNKIRKLEFTLADALQQGADTIITCGGVQSNHCRATAVLGAQLGLKVHILYRGEPEEMTPSGNFFLSTLCGATFSAFPSREYVPRFDEILQEAMDDFRSRGHTPYFITTGASDAVGVWGYVHACEEISRQMQEMQLSFDHIVCAAGSGGTLAGLAAGNVISGLNADITGINVCDDAEYFYNKAREDIQGWQTRYKPDLPGDIPFRVIDGYVGPGYARAEKPVFDLIEALASTEGLILDPVYTGKAFYGMQEEARKGSFGDAGNILFIHTGGIFGLYADTSVFTPATVN